MDPMKFGMVKTFDRVPLPWYEFLIQAKAKFTTDSLF